MKRFISAGLLGAILLMAGQLALTMGLHPERLAPLGHLVQGCAALIVGTALFISGMLGLADGYEGALERLCTLLPQKRPPDAGLEVSDRTALAERNQAFWLGYQRAAGGICLFLAGLLGLTLALGRTSFALYAVGIGVGVSALALAAGVLALGGMRRMRRSHLSVARSAEVLAAQPDRTPELPAPVEKRRRPAYELFKRRGGYGREVERRHSARAPQR